MVSLETYTQVMAYKHNRLDLGICRYIQIHILIQQQLIKKEVMNLKESEEQMGGLGGRKGKGKYVIKIATSRLKKTKKSLKRDSQLPCICVGGENENVRETFSQTWQTRVEESMRNQCVSPARLTSQRPELPGNAQILGSAIFSVIPST